MVFIDVIDWFTANVNFLPIILWYPLSYHQFWKLFNECYTEADESLRGGKAGLKIIRESDKQLLVNKETPL